MKLRTEKAGVIGVRKDKHGVKLVINQGHICEDARALTPKEAIQIGNALIKAAQAEKELSK